MTDFLALSAAKPAPGRAHPAPFLAYLFRLFVQALLLLRKLSSKPPRACFSKASKACFAGSFIGVVPRPRGRRRWTRGPTCHMLLYGTRPLTAWRVHASPPQRARAKCLRHFWRAGCLKANHTQRAGRTSPTPPAQGFRDARACFRRRSGHACCLLLGRQAAFRRQMVNDARQMLAEGRQQLVTLHSRLSHQVPDGILAQSAFQSCWCDRTIRSARDPGARRVAIATALEVAHRVVHTAPQHGPRNRAAAEYGAQDARETTVRVLRIRLVRLAARRARRHARLGRLRIGQAFVGLISKKCEQGHGGL